MADLCGAFFDVIFVVGTSRLNNGETYSGLRNCEMVQPNQRIRVHSASGRRQGCVRSHLGGRTCGIKQLERRHSPRIRSCFQQRQRGCGKSKGEIAISAHRKPRSGGVLFCCHTRIVRRRDACLIELGIGWRWAARERPKNRHPTSSEQGRCWSQTKNVPRNLPSLWRGFFFGRMSAKCQKQTRRKKCPTKTTSLSPGRHVAWLHGGAPLRAPHE